MVNRYDQGNGERKRNKRFSSLSSHIGTKPLSVNRAYTGRKRKSVWLKDFVRRVARELPEGEVPNHGNLALKITFGVSTIASDLDNNLKPIIDCLQEKYGFNDKQIFYIEAYKILVNKGDEFIDWKITKYSGDVDQRVKGRRKDVQEVDTEESED